MTGEPITRGEFELLVALDRHNAARLAYLAQIVAALAFDHELTETQLNELRRALDGIQTPGWTLAEKAALIETVGAFVVQRVAEAVAQLAAGGGLTKDDALAFARHLGPGVKAIAQKNIAEAVAPLEARIAELEAKPSLRYFATWQAGVSYGIGAAVTDHGSLWIARAITTARPGDEDSGWQLAVKRGRPGRDGAP